LIWAWLLFVFASWTCQAAEPGGAMAGAEWGPPGGVAYNAAGYPPSFNGWPEVSPYGHQFQQTRIEDGLWFEEWRDHVRQWHFGIDQVFWRMRRPGFERIGFPIPLTYATIAAAGAGGGAAATVNPADTNISRLKNTGGIADDLISTGMRPHWGFTNADDSGLQLSGFYHGESEDSTTLQLGAAPAPGLVRRPPTSATTTTNLRYIEVPLVNELTGQVSSILFFNREGVVNYDSQSWGAEAQFFSTPFRGRGGNKMRATYGLRYLGVREGLEVILDDSLNGTTVVASSVHSNLVGPELGVRWDVGGQNLRISTFGKVGALANTHRIKINSRNFAGRDEDLQEQHTKISPMVDLGLESEFPLMQWLPLFNRLPGLRDGRFHLGYSYTVVWMMQRPASSITWADPMPLIDDDPRRWHMHGWNLGLDWKW
jgi:hypothetical protein